MKFKNKISILLPIVAFLIFGHLSYAQINDLPDDFVKESWIRDQNVWPEGFLRLRLDRYSQENFNRFKSRIFEIKDESQSSPWEGSYYSDLVELGKSEFRLNFRSGYVQYYVYSCQPELRWINFGHAADTREGVVIKGDFNSNKKSELSTTFVKVKWGDRQYLVSENSLAAFAEKAAGLWVEPDKMDDPNFQKWADYWVKGDLEKEPVGQPQFPGKYASLQRQPIEGLLTFVGKPVLKKDIEFKEANFTQYFANANVYTVTINKGSRSGVKPGMSFDVADSDDTILIKSVFANSSTGLAIRNANDTGFEECYSEKGEIFRCRRMKPHAKVSTITGQFTSL